MREVGGEGREEGDKGAGGGVRGEMPTPCPPPHLLQD